MEQVISMIIGVLISMVIMTISILIGMIISINGINSFVSITILSIFTSRLLE